MTPAPKRRKIERPSLVSTISGGGYSANEASSMTWGWGDATTEWPSPVSTIGGGSYSAKKASNMTQGWGDNAHRSHKRPPKPCSRTEAVLLCGSPAGLLSPEAESFRGMAVLRSQNWNHAQKAIDWAYHSGVFGQEQGVQDTVPVYSTTAPQAEDGGRGAADLEGLERRLHASASRMLDPFLRLGVPESLALQIKADTVEIGKLVARLVPDAPCMIVKLELMQESVCKRFHQDNYVSRAIVSYNGSTDAATEYVHDAFVDFWQLNHRGSNEAIIKDESQICNIGVGNILFMKGRYFPAQPNGLVHRSPTPVRREDGSVETRLVLKVDVAEL